MKKTGFIGGLVLAAALFCSCGQSATAADNGLWQTDYEAALKQAEAEGKYVLVDFSGSDWCHWCMKLDREVFSQKEFADYATANLICVLVDFPRGGAQTDAQKEANQALASRYKVQGFPTVLILSPKGALIKQTGYQPGGAANYVEMIKAIIAADKG